MVFEGLIPDLNLLVPHHSHRVTDEPGHSHCRTHERDDPELTHSDHSTRPRTDSNRLITGLGSLCRNPHARAERLCQDSNLIRLV